MVRNRCPAAAREHRGDRGRERRSRARRCALGGCASRSTLRPRLLGREARTRRRCAALPARDRAAPAGGQPAAGRRRSDPLGQPRPQALARARRRCGWERSSGASPATPSTVAAIEPTTRSCARCTPPTRTPTSSRTPISARSRPASRSATSTISRTPQSEQRAAIIAWRTALKVLARRLGRQAARGPAGRRAVARSRRHRTAAEPRRERGPADVERKGSTAAESLAVQPNVRLGRRARRRPKELRCAQP